MLHLIFSKVAHFIWALFFFFLRFQFKVLFIRLARFLSNAFLSYARYPLYGVCCIHTWALVQKTSFRSFAVSVGCYTIPLTFHFFFNVMPQLEEEMKIALQCPKCHMNQQEYSVVCKCDKSQETSWGNLPYQFHQDLPQYEWERNKMPSL